MEKILKKHADKFRFGLVGVANTGIDFVALVLLVAFGMHVVVANFFSTSIALVFSYFANKNFTFKFDGKHTHKEIGTFFAITLFGLWVIQPVIIFLTELLVKSYFPEKYTILTIGKLLATATTLVWNYFLYKKMVFKK